MRLRDFEGGINKFNKLIPDTVTEILFTDEIKPAEAEIIDVDADGDGEVVAWAENDDWNTYQNLILITRASRS